MTHNITENNTGYFMFYHTKSHISDHITTTGSWFIDNEGKMWVEANLFIKKIYENHVVKCGARERPRRHWICEDNLVWVNG